MLTTKAPTRLTMISWNIDGLEQRNLEKRTEAVVKTIKESSADIVFLQEVVPQTFSHIQTNLPNYECISAKDDGYFVATLLRNGRVYFDRHKVRDYPTSLMDRHLLAVQAHCGNVVMDLLNTHLESGDFAAERKEQLEECFGLMSRRPGERNVIFGGNINLQDPVVKSLEVEGKWKPRCWFDRLYVRPSQTENLLADQFGLIGPEKVEGTQSFPSDHWGIRLGLKLSQEQ